VGLGAREQEQALPAAPGRAREELAPRPVDLAALVAAWPASIQPPNAITIVVRFVGGSRSNSTWSIVFL